MKRDSVFIQRECLFNSVEVELVRRWAFGHVPPAFGRHDAHVLKCFVKTWWNLYHESDCALSHRDRTFWERSQELPASTLDTSELVTALLQIRQLIVCEALEEFRSIQGNEESALAGLVILIHYYTHNGEPQVKQGAL